MSLRIPITKKRIKTHFTYAWWQYVLLAVLAIFGWNLLFTTTHYRSPEHLKVEWYCDSHSSYAEAHDVYEWMTQLNQELLPDMEEVTFTEVGLDQTYGEMQLLVWASAGQGDLYMLAKPRFDSLAAGGAMADLQPYIDSGALHVEGIDMQNGYVTDSETGKMYLVGVPADALTGLHAYGIATEGEVLGLLTSGGNIDNTLKLLNFLLDTMR